MFLMTPMNACGVLCFLVASTAAAPICTGGNDACDKTHSQSLLQKTSRTSRKMHASEELEAAHLESQETVEHQKERKARRHSSDEEKTEETQQGKTRTSIAGVECVDAKFDAGYGGCATYGAGMSNSGYCTDSMKGGATARESCPECGSCVATTKPTMTTTTTTTTLIACKNVVFDAGYGGCAKYGPGKENSPYCNEDKMQPEGFTAGESCPECGSCAPTTGPTTAPTTGPSTAPTTAPKGWLEVGEECKKASHCISGICPDHVCLAKDPAP